MIREAIYEWLTLLCNDTKTALKKQSLVPVWVNTEDSEQEDHVYLDIGNYTEEYNFYNQAKAKRSDKIIYKVPIVLNVYSRGGQDIDGNYWQADEWTERIALQLHHRIKSLHHRDTIENKGVSIAEVFDIEDLSSIEDSEIWQGRHKFDFSVRFKSIIEEEEVETFTSVNVSRG
jgi:hypothetical protein